MSDAYVPLLCHSNFSFLTGASHPQELVERAADLGLETLALTDRDGVYGAVQAHVAAREQGVKLLHGATITVEDDAEIVLLAQDTVGWANLCRLITRGRLRRPKGESEVTWQEVCEHAGGLIALWRGGEEGPLLREAFGDRLYALVGRHRRAEEVEHEERLLADAERLGVPPVAASRVFYHQRGRRRLQDVLTAVRHGVPVAEAGTRLAPNAEHELKTPTTFGELFVDLPAAVRRTLEIARRCHFSLDQIRYRYPSERLPSGMTSSEWLRRLTHEGAHQRYPGGIPVEVREQLEKELALIDELDYPGYFLTMWEIVRFCRERGILAQGRGSAANSCVCYCLGVTAVDPARIELLFERFLSRERAEPPDIDLDIAHERREEVIQHVYEKYGRDHAAMVANVIRYRPRSAVRDVGKALGLPQTELDRLARLLPHFGEPPKEIFRQAGLDPERPPIRHLLELSRELLDFPRHLSIHPGGFLLGHRPVPELVPIENAAMEDRTVIQWDKESVEALGLFKVDLLGLGALTQLDRAFALLAEHRGVDLSLADIPQEDAETFDMICRADTVGVFQIESRAQMAMLPRLQPRNFYDLVTEISIVRPGPISGNMVHPYLKRRKGEEPVTYPHPSLEPVLKRTWGVPLFQEQVMRLAVVAADYTPGEADQLRRDMAAWRRSGRIERHRDRLISRMVAKGIERQFAENIFAQIRGFGEYGFPESHASSFALIAWATSYLKCHYPAEFLCAILNSQPMGFYTPATLVEDAKRHGVEVRPVDVKVSAWECRLEPATPTPHPPVRLGLSYVRGLGEAAGERILAAREERPFADLADFVRRTGLSSDRLAVLAEAGAFESLGLDRRQALWQVRALARRRGETLELPEGDDAPAFRGLDFTETLAWDYHTTRLSPRGHPLEALRSRLQAEGLPRADEVAAMAHGRRVRYVGAVICRQRPGTAKDVVFMTLEDETGFVNVVFWPAVWERCALIAKTESLLGVTGRLQSEEGVVHLIAEQVWQPRLGHRPRTAKSRDFH